MKQRYEKVKNWINLMNYVEKTVVEYGAKYDDYKQWKDNMIRDIRKEFKSIDRYYPDPIGKSMREEWRGQCDEDGEGGYDYRILPVEDPDSWTDEEIEEYIMCEVGYPPICSPYDCTGKRFTRWCSWKRKPCGIVMIHSWGLDV